MESVFAVTSFNTFLSFAVALFCFIQPLTAASYVLPQLAYGGGWSTTVYLSNTGILPANCSLNFYADNGAPLAAPVDGGPPISAWTGSLSAGGSTTLEFPNSGDLKQGWITLELPAGVNGYAVFRQVVTGRPDQEAVVPLGPAAAPAASLAFDNRSMVTAIAVANPTAAGIVISVGARGPIGQSLGSTQISLAARQKMALVLADLPGLTQTAAMNGTVDIVSSTPGAVSVLGLRFRGSAFTSIPAYHGPVSTTPPPAAIPPPVLQGSPTSPVTASLTWATTATNPTGFRVEWRTTGTAFSEIAQPAGSARSINIQGLAPNSLNIFRVRVQTSAGFSGYSNEVQITTPSAVSMAPPTGLRVVSFNQVEATLAWTNNAPEATAMRVEIKEPGSAGFVDIGEAQSLTGMRVTGRMQAQQEYFFRVRAQGSGGYSAHSDEIRVFTPPKINVFLLHGIRQDWTAMNSLRFALEASLARNRFFVNNVFSFHECSNSGCEPNCSISRGAQKLGQLVAGSPPGQIVFVGYSMGGLLARDLIANNWGGALSGRTVVALVTLGTPNLGYPYSSGLDWFAVCDPIAQQMKGDFRAVPNTVILSTYLLGLHQSWAGKGFPGVASTWLAAAGRSCPDPVRSLSTPSGCSDAQPHNDRVVCSQSATYAVNTPSGTAPTSIWTDPERRYVHTQADSYSILWGYSTNLFCDRESSHLDLPLHTPPAGGLLVTRIAEVLNALP